MSGAHRSVVEASDLTATVSQRADGIAASCGWGGYYALQREPDEEPSESEPS